MEALKVLAVITFSLWFFFFIFSLINIRPKYTKLYHVKIATLITIFITPTGWSWTMVKVSEEKLLWIILGAVFPLLTYMFVKSKLGEKTAKLFNIDDRDSRPPY
jgi:hypothetical protein